MYQMARPETMQAREHRELSEDVAAMRSSFSALRQTKPQPIDLAAWYTRIKVNSDGGASAPSQVSEAA